MYVKGKKIVIDVQKTTTTDITAFLEKHCSNVFEGRGMRIHETIKFVEQESLPEYTGRRGNGICFTDDSEVAGKIIQSREVRTIKRASRLAAPDKVLHEGTLGFFARQNARNNDRQPLFIITARHILEKHPQQDLRGTKPGYYFCEQSDDEDDDGELTYVAQQSRGILGGFVHRNEAGQVLRKAGVDIALIEIKENDDYELQEDEIPAVFRENADELLQTNVEKIGSTTPYTKGVIIEANYSTKIGGSNCRNLLLVKATGKTTEFAQPGDSGSLVIRRLPDGSQQAVGIISKRWKWKDDNDIVHQDLAIVTLLKNCFDAVEAEFNIKLKLCAKWQDCRIEPFSA